MEENQHLRESETHATWNEIADLYEANFMDIRCYDESYMRFLALLPGISVLDLGCGPGNISRFLKQQRPELELVGWDIAPNMVDIAAKWVPDGHFLVKDIRDIGHSPEKFDGIICGFGLPYIAKEDRHSFFDGIAQNLTTGGVLYLSFVHGSMTESGYKTGSNGLRVYFHYHDKDELAQALQHRGFHSIEISEVRFERADKSSELHTIIIAQKAGGLAEL
jgi:SAM-dependent methyltransferase